MLLEVEQFLTGLPSGPPPVSLNAAKPGQQSTERDRSFVLAMLSDEPVPISLFRPWASYSQFKRWQKAKLISLHKANGKLCCRPKEFFRFWRTQNVPAT